MQIAKEWCGFGVVWDGFLYGRKARSWKFGSITLPDWAPCKKLKRAFRLKETKTRGLQCMIPSAVSNDHVDTLPCKRSDWRCSSLARSCFVKIVMIGLNNPSDNPPLGSRIWRSESIDSHITVPNFHIIASQVSSDHRIHAYRPAKYELKGL